jgi:hypothetical protein
MIGYQWIYKETLNWTGWWYVDLQINSQLVGGM